MTTQLIMIEGIPGSGKTTIARFVKTILDGNNLKSSLYNEGDLNHPADFESVACLTDTEYNHLISKYDKELFDKFLIKKGNDNFISYGKMKREVPNVIDDKIFEAVSKYDIYNLPLEQYSKLCKEKWQSFASKAQETDVISVFECCFLQNPLTLMLARHNADKSYIKNYINELVEIIKNLNPLLIFLFQDDVKKTFDRVIPERPKEWLDFVIEYITKQEYGKANNINGFEGMVKFYEVLRSFELDIFKTIEFKKLFVDISDLNWDRIRQDIESFLKEAL